MWDGDRTNRDLKLVRCGTPVFTGGHTITTLDSTGDVGQYGTRTPTGVGLVEVFEVEE